MENRMIRPDFAKWGQTPEEIYRLSLEAEHARSRERFQALYLIGTQQTNATQWAERIGRQNQTVMGWIHKYNASGPTRLHYQRTGGNAPLFHQQSETKSLKQSKLGGQRITVCLAMAGH
jgi:transposase